VEGARSLPLGPTLTSGREGAGLGVGVRGRHAENIKNLDIKNLDVLDSTVRWS
jgi:hypothetical protein